nr:hypothetical protein [Fibrobacterota bacterium]
NGILTPELLKKMERIQELLRDAIPDSSLQRMQREAENQQVGMEDVQRNLKDLLDRKDNIQQGLDRAIKMLEMLRDMHALENLSGDVKKLQDAQEKLADKMNLDAKSADDASLQQEQSALRQRMENVNREMDRLGSEQKAFQKMKNDSYGKQAEQNMRNAENSLSKAGNDKPQAQKNAKAAAQHLKQMSDAMEGLIGQMQGGPDPSEISEVLDETLEFARWLDLIRDHDRRTREGWTEEDRALYQRASQIARWLRTRMEKLAARQPYESDVLRREAAALGFQADALVTAGSQPVVAESLLSHSRKAARELLKWLQQANDDGDGSADGSGSGSGSSSGGNSGGKGKGKGQGDGDDEGLDGLAGRLKGMSGKQMAVNQATYQILQSMLNGRSPGQNSPNGSLPLPGGGKPGSQGGQPMGGKGQGQNSANGPSDGQDNGGQPQNGGTERGGANSQQGIAESLEKMAESASDAGGGSRKLRQLAEEARALEKELRQDHPDPEEIRKKQERFQTRLLEAANAMEERGQDRERQAQAYRGEALKPESDVAPQGEDVFRELRKRREQVRGLPIPADQKRQLEWYYESLLTR